VIDGHIQAAVAILGNCLPAAQQRVALGSPHGSPAMSTPGASPSHSVARLGPSVPLIDSGSVSSCIQWARTANGQQPALAKALKWDIEKWNDVCNSCPGDKRIIGKAFVVHLAEEIWGQRWLHTASVGDDWRKLEREAAFRALVETARQCNITHVPKPGEPPALVDSTVVGAWLGAVRSEAKRLAKLVKE